MENLIIFLTHYRKNDNNKVKNVPANSEEVLSKGNHFQTAFCGEDYNEHQVDKE